MLGLPGKTSLGARRNGHAGGGLTAGAVLLAPLLLAACQLPPQAASSRQSAQSERNQAAPNQIVSGQAGTNATAPSATAPKPTPLAATPAVAHGETILPTAARLTGDPQELIGLDHGAVRRTLGQPAQVRREFTAQVWQYVTGDCVVDLYLYDDDAGALKVTYVEARSRTAEPTPTTRCLKSLLERPTASAQ